MSIGSISICTRNAVPLNLRTQMGSNICTVLSRRTSTSCCSYGISRPKYADQSVTTISSCSPNTSQRFQAGGCLSTCFSRRSIDFQAFTVKDLITDGGSRGRDVEISLACKGMNVKLSIPNDGTFSKIKYNMRWPERWASAGLVFGWVVCYSTSEPVHAEAAYEKDDNEENSDSSHVKLSHGKKVYTDYSVIGEHLSLPLLVLRCMINCCH